jgi:glycerol-3-phosphate dehydrogenase (NAD(P)+)
MSVTGSLDEALGRADQVLVVVPSVTMRETVKNIVDAVPAGANVVCATKGIEIESGKRMSQVITEEMSEFSPDRIGVLSGPNLSPEIAAGNVATATVAFPSDEIAKSVQATLSSDVFRVYRSADVIGVELGGALKNIVAIGAAFIDGADAWPARDHQTRSCDGCQTGHLRRSERDGRPADYLLLAPK